MHITPQLNIFIAITPLIISVTANIGKPTDNYAAITHIEYYIE
jgi:hypothetical protein